MVVRGPEFSVGDYINIIRSVLLFYAQNITMYCYLPFQFSSYDWCSTTAITGFHLSLHRVRFPRRRDASAPPPPPPPTRRPVQPIHRQWNTECAGPDPRPATASYVRRTTLRRGTTRRPPHFPLPRHCKPLTETYNIILLFSRLRPASLYLILLLLHVIVVARRVHCALTIYYIIFFYYYAAVHRKGSKSTAHFQYENAQ